MFYSFDSNFSQNWKVQQTLFSGIIDMNYSAIPELRSRFSLCSTKFLIFPVVALEILCKYKYLICIYWCRYDSISMVLNKFQIIQCIQAERTSVMVFKTNYQKKIARHIINFTNIIYKCNETWNMQWISLEILCNQFLFTEWFHHFCQTYLHN